MDLAIGIGMIVAHKNWFKTYDELDRKMEFEVITITLGLAESL